MIGTRDRRQAIALIDEAVAAGARRARACKLLGLSVRTVQRWNRDGGVLEDRRPGAERPSPPYALSDAERAAVREICNSPEHASLPPSRSTRAWPTGASIAPRNPPSIACCAPAARPASACATCALSARRSAPRRPSARLLELGHLQTSDPQARTLPEPVLDSRPLRPLTHCPDDKRKRKRRPSQASVSPSRGPLRHTAGQLSVHQGH
jgi:hypothetical protein